MSCSDTGPEPQQQQQQQHQPEPESEYEPGHQPGRGPFDAFEDVVVERHVEIAAPPEAVWAELPCLLGDDVELDARAGGSLRATGAGGERAGVVDDAVPGQRLVLTWTGTDDDPPSEVEITLERSVIGTVVHVRETRLDGQHLVRSALLARARA